MLPQSIVRSLSVHLPGKADVHLPSKADVHLPSLSFHAVLQRLKVPQPLADILWLTIE
jgi:hypothetical protein